MGLADRTARQSGISRRTFLGATACAAGGSILARAQQSTSDPELRLRAGVPTSRVVQVSAADLVTGHSVHPALLREVLEKLLTATTKQSTERAAWNAILKPDDVVGLKFNQSGQEAIGTSEAMADAIIASILESGWKSEQVVCIEAPSAVVRRHGTTQPHTGYATDASKFASGSDQLASVLDQVTAIIDVPFLKTHNIAGVTCALKNLSHGLVKHPARFHGNGCSPFIADIVALPKIRGKLRLCIVDAMRIVYDGGPSAESGAISDAGTLLASFDPVAVDAVGLGLLNETRRSAGLRPVAKRASKVPYLRAAHQIGLGNAIPDGIELVRASL